MAVSVTPETLRRLIREAEAERGRAAAPTLKRAWAQLAAGYAVELARCDAKAAEFLFRREFFALRGNQRQATPEW